MTFEEYVATNIEVINNHIRVKMIPASGPFCRTCVEERHELIDVDYNEQRGGWVCRFGHVGRNEPLAQGGTIYGPR